jgi:hypothetical protein
MNIPKNARVGRDGEDRPITTPESVQVVERTYTVLAISTYAHNLEELDAKVAEMKRRGFTKANRSWLIRVAVARIDLDTVKRGDQ